MSRTRRLVLVALATLGLPPTAHAATRTVSLGPSLPHAQATLHRYAADVNDFFPHGITIHAGDSLKFEDAGFHAVDLPAKGKGAEPLSVATSRKVTGVLDAAGQPFWFNGLPRIVANPAVLTQSRDGVAYTGVRRVHAAVPFFGPPKPLTVRFPRAGTYTVLCNVHPGMKGVVHVVRRRARAQSTAQVAAAVVAQSARSVKTAKRLAATRAPGGTVDIGSAGADGVEAYSMFPAKIALHVGQSLRFRVSASSDDVHTATFGDDPARKGSYLYGIANSNGDEVDPRAAYPSQPFGMQVAFGPGYHGNGFWSTGTVNRRTAKGAAGAGALTFTQPGTYQFYCLIHPDMHGTVTVR